MLPTMNAQCVLQPAAFCTKKEVSNARCDLDSSGAWVCKKGFPGETCFEEWHADHNGCPTSFAACASSQVWADCADC